MSDIDGRDRRRGDDRPSELYTMREKGGIVTTEPLQVVRKALEAKGCDPHGPLHDFLVALPGP